LYFIKKTLNRYFKKHYTNLAELSILKKEEIASFLKYTYYIQAIVSYLLEFSIGLI